MIYKFFKQNKLFLFITAGIAVRWVLYFYFGHMLIKAMYEGRSIGFLNKIIEGQAAHSLQHYFDLCDNLFYSLFSFYVAIAIIFVTCSIGVVLFIKDRIFKKYMIFYLIFGTLLFFMRVGKVGMTTSGHLEDVFYGSGIAPNLYRVIVPYLTFFLKTILLPAFSWANAANIWNYIFILATLPLFHIYLRKWFDEKVCVLLVLILSYLLTMSFWYPYPGDFLELILFIVGYTYIRDKKSIFLYPLILLASFHKETAIVLVFSYFVSNVTKKRFFKTIVKSFTYFLCWFIPFAGLRIVRGLRDYRGTDSFFGFLIYNIKVIVGGLRLYPTRFYEFVLFLFAFYACFLLFKGKERDDFLNRNIVTIFIFIFITFLITRIDEIRVYYPLLPILIPLAFYPFFGKKMHKSV